MRMPNDMDFALLSETVLELQKSLIDLPKALGPVLEAAAALSFALEVLANPDTNDGEIKLLQAQQAMHKLTHTFSLYHKEK